MGTIPGFSRIPMEGAEGPRAPEEANPTYEMRLPNTIGTPSSNPIETKLPLSLEKFPEGRRFGLEIEMLAFATINSRLKGK